MNTATGHFPNFVKRGIIYQTFYGIYSRAEKPCCKNYVAVIGDLLDSTKLDITVIAAIAGYTALRLSVSVDRGFMPKPAIFLRNEILLTGFAYLGIVFLCASILTTLIVNPWWTVIFILFFTAILSEFVILTLLRQYTFIFSAAIMLVTVYLYLRFIV